MLTQHEMQFRVRYQETDAQGHVHHASFIGYFELGRTELLRANGFSYRELESSGVTLVVAEMACRYHRPARYDDVLTLTTRLHRSRGARVIHSYLLEREGELLASGRSTVACIDPTGRPRALPEFLVLARDRESE